jgi:hypothetical protein
MRLSDIMSAMQLGTYAEVALVLFLFAFLAVGLQVFRAREARCWEAARYLPLEPEPEPAASSSPRPHAGTDTR